MFPLPLLHCYASLLCSSFQKRFESLFYSHHLYLLHVLFPTTVVRLRQAWPKSPCLSGYWNRCFSYISCPLSTIQWGQLAHSFWNAFLPLASGTLYFLVFSHSVACSLQPPFCSVPRCWVIPRLCSGPLSSLTTPFSCLFLSCLMAINKTHMS